MHKGNILSEIQGIDMDSIENNNDVRAKATHQDYGMRIYDPRLGRLLSVDPLKMKHDGNSPYRFVGNDVIRNNDVDGKEPTTPKYLNKPCFL